MNETGLDEVSLQGQPSRVRVLSTTHEERKKAKIDGEIRKHDASESRSIIEVGNTGLVLVFDNGVPFYEIRGDFMPGGYLKENELGAVKGTKIFGFAIKHLRDYLNNSTEIDKTKIATMSSATNPVFKNFLLKFFSKDGETDLAKELPQNEHKLPIVEINLGKLLSLADSHPLVERIERLSKKAEGMTFEATKPV